MGRRMVSLHGEIRNEPRLSCAVSVVLEKEEEEYVKKMRDAVALDAPVVKLFSLNGCMCVYLSIYLSISIYIYIYMYIHIFAYGTIVE